MSTTSPSVWVTCFLKGGLHVRFMCFFGGWRLSPCILSHVCQYGQEPLGALRVMEFLRLDPASSPAQNSPSSPKAILLLDQTSNVEAPPQGMNMLTDTLEHSVPSSEVPLALLRNQLRMAKTEAERVCVLFVCGEELGMEMTSSFSAPSHFGRALTTLIVCDVSVRNTQCQPLCDVCTENVGGGTGSVAWPT